MSSYSYASWRKVILFTAFISIVFIVLLFLWLRAGEWSNNEEMQVISGEGVGLSAAEVVIEDSAELVKIVERVKLLKDQEDVFFRDILTIVDSLVVTSESFVQEMNSMWEEGVLINLLSNSYNAYQSNVSELVHVFNDLHWLSGGEESVLRNDESREILFEQVDKCLSVLGEFLQTRDLLVKVDLSKPYECALPQTRSVFECQDGAYKVVSSGVDSGYLIVKNGVEIRCLQDGLKMDNMCSVDCNENYDVCN